jgi:hypothetical protein
VRTAARRDGRDPTNRVEVVERFYDSFNAQRLDDFVDTLHPEVELQTARGLREGREEAREWATKNPAGGLEQRIVIEDVRTDEGGAHAVALIRRQWWWRREVHDHPSHDGSGPAHEEPLAALFTFRGGLIARWQPFEDRAEALAAGSVEA